jgi:dTDP-4-dehydrorhamnose reductase
MRILVTGASGQLGAYLLRELQQQSDDVVAWSGSRTGDLFGLPLHPVDLTDKDGLSAAFRSARPAVVLHTAALATVAHCYRDPAAARRINVEGSTHLAELAAQSKTRLVMVSTDLVFDGEQGWYREQDAPSPRSIYGQTKLAAEQAVHAAGGVVVRVSLLFGPSLVGRPSFFVEQVAALRERRPCTLFEDEWRTPLGLAAAARGLLAVARSDYQGLLHLGGPERMSRLEMGRRLAAFLGSDPSVFAAGTRNSVPSTEPRPRDVSLNSSRWRQLFPQEEWPVWENALKEMGTE